MAHTTIIADGSFDFSGGVDGSKVTTIASDLTPNGLRRNQLAWLDNATVRGGGILCRTGWANLFKLLSGGLCQGGSLYEPSDGSNPYLMVSVDGHIYTALLDAPYTVTDLSVAFGLFNPATVDYAYFCQGEQFMVIQAGDGVTLPLFWDGTTLRRSGGDQRVVATTLNLNPFVVPAIPPTPLPPPPPVGNQFVDVTLTANYGGGQNQIIIIGAANYMQVAPSNFCTLKYIQASGPSAGNIIPTGSLIFDINTNSILASAIVSFTIPALNGSTTVFVSNTNSSMVNKTVLIDGEEWKITAVGHAAPAAHHVFLVNLTDTPGNIIAGGTKMYSVPELPAATAMDYYMGRLWYAQGRTYSAGDIVGGPSGTAGYNFTDSILKLTENPLCVGGDGFSVPSNAGNIRALKHNRNNNSALGQGSLYIFTRKAVYSLAVPVTRTDWIGADNNNQPLQTVLQAPGSVNDRSVVPVNGDQFYQTVLPSIASLTCAVRNFQQWPNKAISANEDRALQFNNRGLMRFCSGIEFSNRLWQSILPVVATDGINIVSQAVAPMDFDPISSFDTTLPPAWEGMYEGEQILQLFTGDFGGRDRAFALTISRLDNSIEVWELTIDQRFDRPTGLTGPENRVSWYVEFPAFTWSEEFELKELSGGEMWIDKLFGTVEFTFYWRSDADPCWRLWFHTSMCAAKNCVEDVHCPSGYPLNFREGYRFPITFPAPPGPCDSMGVRPANLGYQHQVKVVVKGWARIRGMMLFGHKKDRSEYEGLNC